MEKNDVANEQVEEYPAFKLFPMGKQAEALHHELEFHTTNHVSGFKTWLKENSVQYAKAFPNETEEVEESASEDLNDEL
jgi:hypothetical protein